MSRKTLDDTNVSDVVSRGSFLHRRLHRRLLWLLLLEETTNSFMTALSKPLLDRAADVCQDEATRDWLKENSGSFFQLAEMFTFFKEKLDEEAKEDQCDTVDIVFVAHGRIGRPMVASCLCPASGTCSYILPGTVSLTPTSRMESLQGK